MHFVEVNISSSEIKAKLNSYAKKLSVQKYNYFYIQIEQKLVLMFKQL